MLPKQKNYTYICTLSEMVAKKIKRVVKKVVKIGARALRVADAAILDQNAIAAAKMLEDPCNAQIGPACYRGDQGYRNRFVLNGTYGAGAGQTALALVFVPGDNQFYFIATVGSAAVSAWTLVPGPGASYLAANATGVRSLGACLSATPVAANLATSGQVYTSIVPKSAISLAASNTVDQVLQLCNKYGKVSIDTPMECKWMPASSDEDYVTPGAGNGDAQDTNCILMAFVGLPAATGIVARFTNIVEWKPLPNLGITTESFLGNPSRNTIEHVKTHLIKRNPGWWTNVGSMAYSVLRGYATGGTIGAVGAAMKATKFM